MFIVHEKDNCVFLLGEKLILRQRKGIAIGGHLSSALAIMLANYAEHMSLSAMVNYTVMGLKCNDIIGGLRITDDGLIFVAVNRKWRQATKLAAMVLDLFVGLFMTFSNGCLNLIFEDYCRVYEFLENVVFHNNDKFVVRFTSKNFKCVRKDGLQKIKKVAARFSAMSANININTITATLFQI